MEPSAARTTWPCSPLSRAHDAVMWANASGHPPSRGVSRISREKGCSSSAGKHPAVSQENRVGLLAQRVLLTLCLQPASPGDSASSGRDGVPAAHPQQGFGPVSMQGIVLFHPARPPSLGPLVVSQCHKHINVPSPCTSTRLLRPSCPSSSHKPFPLLLEIKDRRYFSWT